MIIIRIAVLFFIGFMIGKCYGKLNAVSEEIEVINNILDFFVFKKGMKGKGNGVSKEIIGVRIILDVEA